MDSKPAAGLIIYRLQQTPEFLLINDTFAGRRHWTPPKGCVGRKPSGIRVASRAWPHSVPGRCLPSRIAPASQLCSQWRRHTQDCTARSERTDWPVRARLARRAQLYQEHSVNSAFLPPRGALPRPVTVFPAPWRSSPPCGALPCPMALFPALCCSLPPRPAPPRPRPSSALISPHPPDWIDRARTGTCPTRGPRR